MREYILIVTRFSTAVDINDDQYSDNYTYIETQVGFEQISKNKYRNRNNL